ncbi:MAG: gliding motility-associated C-terminal domain-containing protein [Sphingobacteriales bacterium]|nr:MAG: gliding motility-associated C-terminal domain-containing protein [Sphingobacteriales bacterium]
MKHIYLLLLAFLASHTLLAQNQPEQECPNAIPVCQNIYQQSNSYTGFGAMQELDTTNQGCLSSNEKNDVWYVINVSTSGNLVFTITPNNFTGPGIGDDYDFAIWDVTGRGCNAIYSGDDPVRCNYSGTRGITGLMPPPAVDPFDVSLPVVAGQTLVLNISNFSSTQSGYKLDFSGSTASIFDNLPPTYTKAYVRCGYVSDSLQVTMSEPITCASLTANASDFELRSATAPGTAVPGISIISALSRDCQQGANYSINYTLKFSGILPPGDYLLVAKTGTDGNTLLDNCGNEQIVGEQIAFKMINPIAPVITSIQSPACTHALVTFDREVRCKTVAPDGSDFFITGPSQVNVIHADASLCDSRGLIKTIDVQFDRSILVPGEYLINFKNGTDSNSILDTCGAIVNVPYRFTVTDEGATPTAAPPVLCETGYTTLTATTSYQPYGSTVRCGTNNGPDILNSILRADTVGTLADTTNGIATVTPFDATKFNARAQILYSAADLRAVGLRAGRIKSLSFFVGKKNSTTAYKNLNLKMLCTTQNSMFGGFIAGAPIVFSRDTFRTRVGENKFVLDNAYDWDGQSNLLVELCYSNTDTTTGATRGFDQLVYTNVPNSMYRRVKNTRDTAGCAFVSGSGTGGASDARPTISFGTLELPAPTYEWLWQPGGYVQDSTAQTTLAFVPNDRSYGVQIKDADGCYRRGSVAVRISVRNPYGYQNNDTSICIGGKAHLLVGNGVRYQWFPAEGLSCTDCADPYAAPTQTTTYYAAIFDPYGCSDTLSATVTVNALPLLNAGKDTSVLYGNSIPLYVMAPGAIYYAWTPIAGLNYANIPNPLASPLETTTYTVQVIDTNYCIAYDTVTVRVNRNVPVFVPNAFTPNGDNKNDLFQVMNLSINRLTEMRIYNRWGTEVCNTTDNTRGWDGLYKGVPQESGVYKYIIRITKPDGAAEMFKGDLLLLR